MDTPMIKDFMAELSREDVAWACQELREKEEAGGAMDPEGVFMWVVRKLEEAWPLSRRDAYELVREDMRERCETLKGAS